MTPPAELSTVFPSEKDALIAALLARVKALLEEVEGLRTENAALRDKLSLPPKTPRNSSCLDARRPWRERSLEGPWASCMDRTAGRDCGWRGRAPRSGAHARTFRVIAPRARA